MNGKPKFDTTYQVETPENVDLIGKAAGPVVRICAYLIDFAIRSLVVTVFVVTMLILGQAGIGIFFIVTFLLEWFYPIFFELVNNGQTPGKKIFGITVVHEDQTPINFSSSLTRNLLRAADFLPSFYVFGLVTMVSNDKFKRLGDLAAGTIVIYQEKNSKKLNIPKVQSQMPTISLSLDDQVAIINFTQRHEELSLQRKIELANILSPITKKKENSGVEFIQGMGCWLLGDKK